MNADYLRLSALTLLMLALLLLVVPWVGGCDWPLGEAFGSDDACREAVANYVASAFLILGGAAVMFGLYLAERARR